MATEKTTTGEERLGRAIDALEAQLQGLTRDLAVLHRDIGEGKLENLADAQRRSGEIRQWLGIALEMEMKLEKRKTKGRRDTVTAAGSIDLDTARHQIGCRLDRLRRTRCPGRVPE